MSPRRKVTFSDEERIATARVRLLARHKSETWPAIGRSLGLPGDTVRLFASGRFTPKTREVLAMLTTPSTHRHGVLVIEIHRDELGRFAKE
jgi:hypothetical protein